MALHFTLDDEFKRLDWGVPDERKPTLTNEEAMMAVRSRRRGSAR
jgi:hypothetical protein